MFQILIVEDDKELIRFEWKCIVLVQKLLQHSSVATTQRYIDVDQRIDKALIEQCTLF